MRIPDPSPFDGCPRLPILDPAFKADPHPFYGRLRESGGIHPVELPSGTQAWVATRHATARALLSDARLSKCPLRPAGGETAAPAQLPHPLFEHLLMMDPPRHTRMRGVMARALSSRRVAALRPLIEGHAAALLDAIEPRGESELIADFAVPLPFFVVCDLVGVPRDDRRALGAWLQDLERADLDAPEEVPLIASRISGYLDALAEAKRPGRDDDMLTALLEASGRGELGREQLPACAFLLLAAGHETTSNLIGNGVFSLLADRTAWERLCAEPSLAGRAIEELLRFQSPLEMASARFATEDIAMDGVRIRAGDMLFAGISAANRDPRLFADADRMDILRPEQPRHMAFGHGIHACLGAGLARLEGELALQALTRRFPGLRLAVAPPDCAWKPGLITRGLRELRVRFD